MQKKKEGPSMETIVFQTLLTCILLLDQLDEVSETKCFKRELKFKTKALMKELERVVDKGTGVALDKDEPLFMELLSMREKLLKKIGVLDSYGLRILDRLIDQSKELELCGMTLIES